MVENKGAIGSETLRKKESMGSKNLVKGGLYHGAYLLWPSMGERPPRGCATKFNDVLTHKGAHVVVSPYQWHRRITGQKLSLSSLSTKIVPTYLCEMYLERIFSTYQNTPDNIWKTVASRSPLPVDI